MSRERMIVPALKRGPAPPLRLAAAKISGTVAALRLDAVLALGFGISRARAVILIKGGLVR